MAKRKGFKMTQKNQKNIVSLVAGLIGAISIMLATFGQWKVPAVGATHTYADVHDKVGDFINFLGLGSGTLVLVGIVGLGIAGLLYRK